MKTHPLDDAATADPAVADSASAPAVERTRSKALAFGVQSIGITALLIGLIIAFALLNSRFFTVDNAQVIIGSVAVIAIVSVGQTLVVISGGFDLSVGGTIPLAAVVYALLANAGLGVLPSLLLTMVVGGLVGMANGLVIAAGKINPLIATLATLSITGGLAYSITGGQSVPFDDEASGVIADPSIGRIPYFVWILVALAIVTILVLRFTVYGRSLYALGGNPDASWLAGMRVTALSASTYVIVGMLAGLAGVALASQLLAGDGSLGTSATLTSIAAVILGGASLAGGTGSVLGTLIGVLILGTLANGLSLMHVPSFYQQITTGVVLLLAVGFARLRTSLTRRL